MKPLKENQINNQSIYYIQVQNDSMLIFCFSQFFNDAINQNFIIFTYAFLVNHMTCKIKEKEDLYP